jgi:micrococcal nuclease
MGDHRSLIVKRVIDGDTLLLSDNQRIRLIGVDTPEEFVSRKLFRDAKEDRLSVRQEMAMGQKAADYTRSMVQGRPVSLRYDAGGARLDRYGRTLAYVDFVPLNFQSTHGLFGLNTFGLSLYRRGFLNALLIEAGVARAYTRFPFRYERDFEQLERQARSGHRGFWQTFSRF